jgi:hypothetical protein
LISPTPTAAIETPTPEASPTPEPQIEIIAPLANENIQGAYVIFGTSAQTGFISAELTFAYPNADTWFLISESVPSVVESDLFTWDTTKITDGYYNLRLRVYLADGSTRESLIPIRIRNYSPADTPTPTPVTPTPIPIYTATLTPTITATSTPYPTPTAFSQNPMELSSLEIGFYVLRGAAAVILLFAIFGFFVWIRNKK